MELTRKEIMIHLALSAPVIADNEKFVKLLEKDAEKAMNLALDKVDAKYKMIHDAMHGVDIVDQYKELSRVKDVHFVGNFPSVNAGTFRSFMNELQIDSAWMQFYSMVDADGADSFDIIDFSADNGWMDYKYGDPIKLTPLGDEAFIKIQATRSGESKPVPYRWLRGNGRYTLNDVVNALITHSMTHKANTAYTQLGATAGIGVESFTNTLIETLNAAYVTLATNNEGRGYNISAQTPMLLLHRANHTDLVRIALNTVRNMGQGSERIVEYPIFSVPTFNSNVPLTVGGVDAGILIIPGFKNKWGTFERLRIEQERKIRTDGLEVTAQEYYGSQVDTTQKRVIELVASGS